MRLAISLVRTIPPLAFTALLCGGAALADDADLLLGLPTEPMGPAEVVETAEGAYPQDADLSDRPGQALRFRIEANSTGFDRRTAFPAPPREPADSTSRLRAVVEGNLPLGETTSFRLNAALNLTVDNTDDVTLKDNLRFDLREAYLLVDTSPFTFELGRINIRNGTAVGFSPTDFFRAPDTGRRPNLDPSEARLNRLGVLAMRAGYLWESGAVSLTYAPKITDNRAWLQDKDIWGLHLGSTNPRERVLLSLTQTVTEGISPELFVLWEEGDTTLGFGASASIGENWILYGEWSRGLGLNLLDAALARARDTGTLAPPLAAALGDGEGERNINRAAIGFSYTSPRNLIATFEYHYNGAGFDKDGWDRYFDLAQRVENDPRASGQLALASLRGALMQEPLSRHSLFGRLVQNDPFPDTTLTAMAAMSLEDYSYSLQLEAEYDVTERFTLSGRVGGHFGNRDTDYGSRSNKRFLSVGLEYHF